MPKGSYIRKKGYHQTEEHKQKRFETLSKTRKGKSLEQFGHNMQICKCFICRTKRGEAKGENHSNYGNRGIKNHLFGKKRIFSDQHKKNLSIGKTGKHQPNQIDSLKSFWNNHPEKRKEVGLRFSKANKGKPKSEEHIKHMKIARAKRILPVKDTSIEIQIQDFLYQLYLNFIPHQYIYIPHGYPCDIYLNDFNAVIECDGDYWHSRPERKQRDDIRTKEMKELGYIVIRLPEHQIRKLSLQEFEDILKDNIGVEKFGLAT